MKEVHQCSKCGEEKPISMFLLSKEGWIKSACIDCRRLRLKKRDRTEEYRKKKESGKIKEEGRKFRQNNPEKNLLYSSRIRAKQKGIKYTINVEDIIIPKKCPYLGIDIIWNPGTHNSIPHSNSPSLDRIHSDLGYTPENIRVCSWLANSLKNDTNTLEMAKLCYGWEILIQERNEHGIEYFI